MIRQQVTVVSGELLEECLSVSDTVADCKGLKWNETDLQADREKKSETADGKDFAIKKSGKVLKVGYVGHRTYLANA
jgi:hypothetical protein